PFVRQVVAALEEEAAVETEGQRSDFVQDRQQDDDAEDDRAGLPGGRDEAGGEGGGGVPERDVPSAHEQAGQQEHAPRERDDAGLTLQALISGGFVFVHVAKAAALTGPRHTRASTLVFVIVVGAGRGAAARPDADAAVGRPQLDGGPAAVQPGFEPAAGLVGDVQVLERRDVNAAVGAGGGQGGLGAVGQRQRDA